MTNTEKLKKEFEAKFVIRIKGIDEGIVRNSLGIDEIWTWFESKLNEEREKSS